MSLSGIIYNLHPKWKLIYGISFGVLVYALLRWLIYLANRESRARGLDKVKKDLSQEQKLDNLMALGGN